MDLSHLTDIAYCVCLIKTLDVRVKVSNIK